jgi:very-short-patch-repair endonuclease
LFIADFYCAEKRLLIEIDGKIHDEQKDYDKIRTEIIKTQVIKVVRFRNEEIINNIENVIEALKRYF